MSSIPGFLVLGAFPLALLFLLIIAIVGAWLAFRSQETTKRKWFAAAAATAVVVLVPTWDVIVGRAAFAYFCATDVRTTIYKTINLGTERTKLNFPSNPADYRKLDIAQRYPYGSDGVEVVGPGKVTLRRQYVSDAASKEVLGETRSYHYGGGWFLKTFTGFGGGDTCRPDADSFRTLLEHVFGTP